MPSKRAQGNSHDKVVDPELIAKALAKAVADGDIVNLRLLFQSFSPARGDSTERFDMAKYDYLLPGADEERAPAFLSALGAVKSADTWSHVQSELEVNRRAQLPSELVVQLADNAVRAGKYTSAAQAYEMLRIRARMQEEFFSGADEALAANDIPKAVRGYVIAAALDYDYAAFPEPLPKTPDYQTRALMLHGDYPLRPEDCLAMQAADVFLRAALSYMLLSADAAGRLEKLPVDTRVAFLKELVRQRDPEWDSFARRYHDACDMVSQFAERVRQAGATRSGLAGEIDEVLGEDPREIEVLLLGRRIDGGEWWQYLKELASKHPAAVLFVARQFIGDTEVIFPRRNVESPVVAALSLA